MANRDAERRASDGGRLAEKLEACNAAYRMRLVVDLTLITALLRLGRARAATRALDEHRAALRAYCLDLNGLVHDATAERGSPG